MVKINTNVDIKPSSLSDFIITLFSNIILLICVFIALTMFGFRMMYDTAPVVGQSMSPTLNQTGADTDSVYIHKFGSIDYGDVVVLTIDGWTEDGQKNIIKRVIGLGGDRIGYEYDIDEDYYYFTRNGERLIEDYIDSQQSNETKVEQFKLMCHNSKEYDPETNEYIVPSSSIFVLGDNRDNSLDSGIRGAFHINDLWGRVDFITPNEKHYLAFYFEQFFSFGKFQYHI